MAEVGRVETPRRHVDLAAEVEAEIRDRRAVRGAEPAHEFGLASRHGRGRGGAQGDPVRAEAFVCAHFNRLGASVVRGPRRAVHVQREMCGPTSVAVREFVDDQIPAGRGKGIRKREAGALQCLGVEQGEVFVVDVREAGKVAADDEGVQRAFVQNLQIRDRLAGSGMRHAEREVRGMAGVRRRGIGFQRHPVGTGVGMERRMLGRLSASRHAEQPE